MKKKYIVILFLIIWGIWIGTHFLIDINIKGPKEIKLKMNEAYKENGASAKFLKKQLKLDIESNVNTKVAGTYYVCYKARNQFGIARYQKRTIIVTDQEMPTITLKGSSTVLLKEGETYKEEGFTAHDNKDGDIAKKVVVENKVDTSKVGTYYITYKVTDESKNETTVKRSVRVLSKNPTYLKSYNKVDNTAKGWWSGNKKNQTRPTGGEKETILAPYHAYFLGEDKKTIYLTYDEGANDTYVKETLDVLKEKNVKVTFFLCRYYIVKNLDIMKRMVNEGHLVGNHTNHHETMAKYANEKDFNKYLAEIKETEDAFYKATGKQMAKVYREPRGDWSFRSLKIMSDLGYRSYFWSADYLDWSGDVSKDKALSELMKRYHNGAIYLIHPKNKGNYQALPEFIDKMRALGYEFGLVDEIGN